MSWSRWLSPSRLVIIILTVTLTSFILFVSIEDNCTCATVDTLVQKIRDLQGEIRVKDEARKTRGQRRDSSRSETRREDNDTEDESQDIDGEEGWDPHVLCLLIPFRDRFEELMEFVPYMDSFLAQQMVRHRIFVINQIDNHRFNRASLLNIGYQESRDQCSYVALHDVDLLPRNPAITYHYKNVVDGPHHVSSPDLHPKYTYKDFIGGIMLMTCEQFETLNGLSNRFWGWGREDDELYMRIQEAGMKISRPKGITTGRATFYHIHDKKKRKRDMKRLGTQHKESFKRDKDTGLDNVGYHVRSQQQLTIGGAKATLIHVKVECDIEVSPWCDEV